MNALIKAATVIDAQSTYHGETVDLRIKSGIITEIASNLSPAKGEKVIAVYPWENLGLKNVRL